MGCQLMQGNGSVVSASVLDLLTYEVLNRYYDKELQLVTESEVQSETQLTQPSDVVVQPVTYFHTSAKEQVEAIAFQVGVQLCERAARDKARFVAPLEAVKFVCRELWPLAFRKPVDNLRTNHRGVYVLQDNRFRWLLQTRISPMWLAACGSSSTALYGELSITTRRLPYACGLVR